MEWDDKWYETFWVLYQISVIISKQNNWSIYVDEVTNLVAIPLVFFKELKIKAKISNRSDVSNPANEVTTIFAIAFVYNSN